MKASARAIFGLLIILTLALGACGGSPEATVAQPEPTDAPDNPAPTATAAPPEPTATAVEPTAESEPTVESEPTAESEPLDESEESDPPQEEQTASAGDPDAGDPGAGEEHFQQVCFACHGADGTGIEGLGKDLTTSEFVAGLTDAELLAFIQEGRPVDHPDNTTGVAMPPRGGNPDFTDDQLLDIIAFIRTLQEQ